MPILTPHQKSALQFNKHISLTANAGSGKTFVLSRRYIEIVLAEGISLRNIAAITFTDRAASELYKKIAGQIEDRLREEVDQNIKRKLENMRRQLVSANISTIHSFCIDILREFPVESGLDANFSPIDEQISSELIEISVEEMIKTAIATKGEDEKLKYLIRFFSSKKLMTEEIISLIKNRKNVLKIASDIYSNEAEKIASYFSDNFRDLFSVVFLKDIEKVVGNLTRINNAVLKFKPDNRIAVETGNIIREIDKVTPPIELLKIILKIKELVTTQTGSIKNKEYTGKFKEDLREEINYLEKYFLVFNDLEIIENTSQTELELAKLGKEFLYFFDKALSIYYRKKQENGYLDYEDILLYTQEILTKENVRKALSEKYKYIMVDEYQDTNEIQYNIFIPILDNLKRGNLFVVGDEKQSIYMFRDAELEVFNRTKSEISEESGPEFLLSLPDSFRMAPSICLFANNLFKRLFGEPDSYFNEVEYSELVCAREDNIEGKIEILLAGNEDNKGSEGIDENDETDNPEAHMVSKRILNLVLNVNESPSLRWNDIAILCRKRKAFIELEKVFTKYKIPYTIIGGKGFYQRQSIYDVFNYFSFLLDSKNDTALTGILRSPFFSISDAKIFEISVLHGDCLWTKLKGYGKILPDLMETVSTLEENISLSNSINITSMLRKILDESNLLVTLSAHPNGAQEIANINKLIKLSDNFMSQGFKTLYDYVIFLKESINNVEDEAQASLSDETDTVKILTIHQSKGLEFPAVFLYKCDDTTVDPAVKSKKISVNKELGLLTKVPVSEGYFKNYVAAPIVGIANIIAKRKNNAENKRLFYVAITRAINYLFISARSKNNFNYSPNSFMGMLKESFNLDFQTDEFEINSMLKKLKMEDGEYINESKNFNIKVPIIKTVNDYMVISSGEEDFIKKNLKICKVNDKPEGEIISATKVAVFRQCPVKYQLTYEYGFGNLFQDFSNWMLLKKLIAKKQKNYEYKITGEEGDEEIEAQKPDAGVKSLANIKGIIIHELLEKGVAYDNLEISASKLVKRELLFPKYNMNSESELTTEISKDMKNFLKSKEYKYLEGFKEFKNEFQIYIKANDYYLYGIIDKLIFSGDKLIIVDYKTDDISIEEFEEKSRTYIVQLEFYALLVSKLFSNFNETEIRLIFIKYPDNVVTTVIDKGNLVQFEKDIKNMVDIIRAKNFSPNFFHCNSCHFGIRGNCIKN